MKDETIKITSKILRQIRSIYPAANDMSDSALTDCLLKWEKQFDYIEGHGLSRNLISALAFPTFNEFALFQKSR